jgi:hypothetical protein
MITVVLLLKTTRLQKKLQQLARHEVKTVSFTEILIMS